MLVSGHRGPCSKYSIDITEGNFKGELEVKWGGEPLKVGITVAIATKPLAISTFN